MDSLETLITELHRRSIWQVLSIYLVGAWGALEVVDGVTENAGLPDWVPAFALVLLVIGLPVVAATAFVQEGMPGSGRARGRPDEGRDTSPDRERDPGAAPVNPGRATSWRLRALFTWRNAIGGGAAAGLLLATAIAAYFLMRATGVGPAASLLAQGLIEAGEPVVLAEFHNNSDDPSLGGVVTAALRVDLASSRALTLVEPARIRETLVRMERAPGAPLTAEVASEVAIREGIKAVIDGEVGSAGSGYIFVATLRAAESGSALATFRRAASGPGDVIAAIDGLSQDIREKAGESLRSIKAEKPLEAVTTSSLEALRLLTEAEALADAGQTQRAKDILEQALEVDPEFAMAWRKLAVVLQTSGEDEPGQRQAAATRAWELRDRLTERERYLATAHYHQDVTGDTEALMRAHRGVLDEHPDDRASLNNLSIAYQHRTRYEDALEVLERAVGGPGASSAAYTNWVAVLAYLGRVDEARTALDSLEAVYPNRTEWNLFNRWQVAAIGGDVGAAEAAARALMAAPDVAPGWRAGAGWELAVTDALQGRLSEARDDIRTVVEEALADERHEDARFEVEWAGIQRLVDGDALRAAGTLRAFLSRGDRLRYPPVVEHYVYLTEELAYAGLEPEVSMVLDEWAERSDGAAIAAVERGRRLVAALRGAEADPAGALERLERLASELGCPRCFQWERAELAERSGDLVRAEELYVRSMAAAENLRVFALHRVLGHERLGRVYDALDRDAEAASHYVRFAELWEDADADVQARVRAARDRATTLSATVGDG